MTKVVFTMGVAVFALGFWGLRTLGSHHPERGAASFELSPIFWTSFVPAARAYPPPKEILPKPPDQLVAQALKAQMTYRQKISNKRYLAIIDYDRPYTEERLWVIDTHNNNGVVVRTTVSHAARSGDLYAMVFSNRRASYLSPKGFFVTDRDHFVHGSFGRALRVHGLELRNSNSYQRGIMFHPAGAWTHSLGCFMTPDADIERVVRLLAGGALVFVHKS